MRVAVIGATGHIGGYLVPRLVAAGHEVSRSAAASMLLPGTPGMGPGVPGDR